MNDFKSKLPDFQELTKITGKFFKDIKKSVTEIVDEYKKKRAEENAVPSNDIVETPRPTDVRTPGDTVTTDPVNPTEPLNPVDPIAPPSDVDPSDKTP